MEYLLFMDPKFGVDFVLKKKLDGEKLEYKFIPLKDDDKKSNLKTYKKYSVKTTPVLLKMQDGVVIEKVVTTDEIVSFFKNVPDKKI